MNPTTQDTQPAQATNNPAPIYDESCYYFPGVGISLARRGRVVLYPGWLIMMDVASNQESYRVALTPQLVIQTVFGTSQFKTVDGQKLSAAEKRKYSFFLYNPSSLFNGIAYLMCALSPAKRKQAKRFTAACKQAAGAQ